MQRTVSDAQTGEFLVTLTTGKNYLYNVSKAGYLFFSENFALLPDSTGRTRQKPYQLNIALTPMVNDTSFAWNVGETVVLRNVFFALNSAELQPQSHIELNKLASLLTDHRRMKVEISGHTDSTGTVEYNQKLSAERARSRVRLFGG